MNVLVFPGYGDRVDYIEKITNSWRRRYGLIVHVLPFGTDKPASQYDARWKIVRGKIHQLDNVACIGISFGGGVALRGLIEYPDQVTCAVCIVAPHDLKYMNPESVRLKYPMLKPSLQSFETASIPPEKVMTIRSLYDGVVPVSAVPIEGATNIVMPVVGHSLGIVSALVLGSGRIARFISSHSDTSYR